jgi:uncharacterized protein (TIGR00299 family) protein
MRTAYFQCIGGASGDMVLGSLIDSGVPLEHVEGALGLMGVRGVTLSSAQTQRGGLTGRFVQVVLDEDAQRRRSIDDFVEVILASDLPESVRDRSVSVFRRLENAERAAHRSADAGGRLHELGTLDTLVDVVGSIVGLDYLEVERVCSSPFPLGSGIVRSDHGVLPVPSPATAEIFTMSGAPVVPAPGGAALTGELVTPTGAAILTVLGDFEQPDMWVESVGYGLGARDPEEYPNALALWIGDADDPDVSEGYAPEICLLETNVDDTTGEILGFAMERLFEFGALDVWFTPIQMKKNRPGTMISAIVNTFEVQRLSLILMTETSTLGVRVRSISRIEAERQVRTVDTKLYGPVRVKIKKMDGEPIAVSPEYEDCRRIAHERDEPLQVVYNFARAEAEQQILNSPDVDRGSDADLELT